MHSDIYNHYLDQNLWFAIINSLWFFFASQHVILWNNKRNEKLDKWIYKWNQKYFLSKEKRWPTFIMTHLSPNVLYPESSFKRWKHVLRYIVRKANWGVWKKSNCKKYIKHFLQLSSSCLQVVHFVASHKNHYVSNVINCFNAHTHIRIIGPILIGITSPQNMFWEYLHV